MESDNKNNKIARFGNILYAPELPALYNQGLTDYEILVRLASAINNNAQVMTSWYSIVEELQKILADVDVTIKEKVIEAIQKLYDNGELAEIIGNVITNSMTGKTGDIDLAHMGYILHKAHSWGVSNLPAVDANITVDEELYSALQGNCVFTINGNMFWACAYVCQNGYKVGEENNAIRLYIYTVNQNGSLSYVTDKEFAVIGHANSMTYKDGYLYISPTSYAGNSGGLTCDIKRISFDGETLGGAWNSGLQRYTAESKTPTGWIYDTRYCDNICSYDGVLYVFDEFFNMYSYDWDSNIVTLVEERINGVEGRSGTSDGLSVTDNYIYFGASGYRIKRYNKQLKYVDWVYQLPAKASNGAYKLGEVEGFTVIDGIIYLASFYNLCGVSTKYNTYSITHFYRQNLATNNITIPNAVNWSNGYVMERGIFVIDGNLPADNMNSINDYFTCPCVQVALDFLENNDYLQRGELSIRQRRNLSTIDIRTTKPLVISGSYYRSNIEKDLSPSLGHIYCTSNTNLYLIDIIVNNRLPLDISDSNATDNCVFNGGGTINVQNCTFPTGLITNAVNVKYAIKAYHGTLNARTDKSYSTNPEQWVKYRTTEGVSNPSYTAGSVIVRNINQVVTGN